MGMFLSVSEIHSQAFPMESGPLTHPWPFVFFVFLLLPRVSFNTISLDWNMVLNVLLQP